MRKKQPQDEARQFRHLCCLLGASGTSERHKRKRQTAFRLLKQFPQERRHALLAETWQPEEARRRWRLQFTERFRFWGALGQIVIILLVLAWCLLAKQAYPALFFIIPSVIYTNLYALLYFWSTQPTATQRGMARLILRQEVAQADIGRLVEMTEFHLKNEQEHSEIFMGALHHLIRLLPTLRQTDETLLDNHHKKLLRRWVVRAQQQLTTKNGPTLPGGAADFAAAALTALGATGGWQEKNKEADAARRAVQELADAQPRQDEPLNHLYVREVARELLAQIKVGQAR